MAGPDLRPTAVLFACGMNSVRSPMAEALTQKLFPGQIYVKSAGVRAGKLDPFVDAVMAEIGVDMSAHRPKSYLELEESGFDLIVTLAPEAHHWALDLTRTDAVDVEYWPTMDPTLATGSREQILNEYRAVRDMLMMRIKKRLNWTPPPSG
ncbi:MULTISPECIES: low molecular weight phosphatase family protein [Stappiaceae]|uniref:Arsenate reductase n=3 Tax=Stappiaceae TaxID=2821832 RepID=A0A0M7AM19_9HYPH|nr:arsenate reductase ArsC [Roseibium alexandrii]EEE46392.2 Protein-tyrosine-phosphatase [Roseibium alexandrii DFL-11]OJJ13488.1 protein-tyrosine-phosphatase [Alphaproteobacteria bacterium AO1-B]CTQ76175.1 Arsenate reductase [Roseibium alexandrii]